MAIEVNENAQVEDNPRHDLPRLLNPVDKLTFVIGLPEVHLKSEALADDLAPFLDLRERRVTVDVGLAFAEQ
jgi:hypothetical protein